MHPNIHKSAANVRGKDVEISKTPDLFAIRMLHLTFEGWNPRNPIDPFKHYFQHKDMFITSCMSSRN